MSIHTTTIAHHEMRVLRWAVAKFSHVNSPTGVVRQNMRQNMLCRSAEQG
jgi:hypothetical protein